VTGRRFALRIATFVAALVPMYFGAHAIITELHHTARTRNDASAVYVLGDSRTFNAVDLTALRERSGRPIYSYAQHAMSDYAFLTMAERVPPKATVLFGPSWGFILRDGDDASYHSGYSARGLWRILTDGDDDLATRYGRLRRIFVANRNPLEAPLLRDTPYPLAEGDAPNLANLEKVKSFYAFPKPPYAESKRRMVREGIEALIGKGCTIHVLDIPIPADIRAARDRIYGSVIDALDLDRPGIHIHRDILLVDPDGKNVWQDADHMNARGRRLMTDYLIARVL
jgi:hypothetical protein